MAAAFKLKSNIIEIVCRTCLKINKNRFNIFEHSQNNKFISELLVECTPLKVQKDDGFPVNICNNCLEKLNSVLDFREMVMLSSTKLQNFYQNQAVEKGKGIEGSNSSDTVIKDESLMLETESSDLFSDVVDNPVYKCVAEIGISEKQNTLNNNQENSNKQLILQNTGNKEKCSKEDKPSIPATSNNENHDTEFIKDDCKSENIGKIGSIKHEGAKKNQTHLKQNDLQKSAKSNMRNRISPQDEFIDDSVDDSPCSNYSSDSECEDENDSSKQILDADERKDKNTFNWIEKHIEILDNPDCKKIISMGLSKKEKDRATVFCKECGKTVNFRYYVQVHAQTHMGNIPFKCEKCDKSFAQRHILNQHIRAVHEKTIKLSCDVCGKGFTSPSIMLQHKAKHSDAKPYKCDTCGKGFKLSGTLKKHYVVHKNDKQFTCELCGKSFLEKNNLREHILSHVTEKNFNCTVCPKSFTTKRGLDSHLKRHSGNRPYVCSYCGKSFTVSSVLRKHILIHTGAKPYTCKICDRKFTQDSSLRYHMRIHTGEKPYSCESCCISFRYKHLLKNHMNRLHKSNVTEESKS